MADTTITAPFPHEIDSLSFPVGSRQINVSVKVTNYYGADVRLVSGTFAGDGTEVRIDGLAEMVRAAIRSHLLAGDAPAWPDSYTSAPLPCFSTLTVCPQPGIEPDAWEDQWGGNVPTNPATGLPYTYSTYPAQYTVFPFAPGLPYTSAEWLESRFLTPATCKRMPCHSGFERLCFLAELGGRYTYGTLRAIWAVGGRLVTYERSIPAQLVANDTTKPGGGAAGVYVAGFVPSYYASCKDVPEAVRGFEPSSFIVQFGARSFTYYVSSGAGNDCFPRPLLYLTGFGLLDRLFCYGNVEEEYKPSYTAAYTRGLTRNAAASVTPSETWHTGELHPGELAAARDLALSTMLFDGETGEELTLTSSEIKTSNDRTQRKTASFTLRRAAPGAQALRRAVKAEGKVFDRTYDATYE